MVLSSTTQLDSATRLDQDGAAIPMKVTAVGRTDVGLQREHNEDCFLILEKHGLFVVADGMGGHQAGDVASKMAADAMASFFETTENDDATWPFPFDPKLSAEENRLQASIMTANKQIFNASISDRSVHGMGTTVVGIVCSADNGAVYVAHVGDSRAYRLRDGDLLRLTEDHSLVNDYLAMMPNLPKEATDLLPKNVITRALGMQDVVTVDLAKEIAQPGDVYLLCSDGLCGQVEDRHIAEVCNGHAGDMARCADALVKLANDAGGDDNVTVVLVRVTEAAGAETGREHRAKPTEHPSGATPPESARREGDQDEPPSEPPRSTEDTPGS